MQTKIPKDYRPKLDFKKTGEAITLIREFFARELSDRLNLVRVAAPLMVSSTSGLNDNLANGERPVCFEVKDLEQRNVEIVHSLAKWKRLALEQYGFKVGEGLYTDMNAIRRDEGLDNIHSVYVDQWDWEKIISPLERNKETLKSTVKKIYSACKKTETFISKTYPCLENVLPPSVFFITTEELAQMYPGLPPEKREEKITKEKGAVFLMEIGKPLYGGKPHEKRAPDYDDWNLNGDLLFWYPLLERAVEISSMGIRVDPKTLKKQLIFSGCEDREKMPYHKKLLSGELPETIGGGIGQSRLCMFLLEKAHIGEVQPSIWPKEILESCRKARVPLL